MERLLGKLGNLKQLGNQLSFQHDLLLSTLSGIDMKAKNLSPIEEPTTGLRRENLVTNEQGREMLSKIQERIEEALSDSREEKIVAFFKKLQKTRFDGSKAERHVLMKDELLDESNPQHAMLLSLLRVDEEADELLSRLRIKPDEVNLEDLIQSFQGLSRVEQWVASLRVDKLVARAIIPLMEVALGDVCGDKLLAVSRSSESDLTLVSFGLFKGLATLLKKSVSDLKICKELEEKQRKEASDETSSSKFVTMKCGPVSSFYQGLGDRVGNRIFLPHTYMTGKHASRPTIS